MTLPETIAQQGYEVEHRLNEIEVTNKILDAKGVILEWNPRRSTIRVRSNRTRKTLQRVRGKTAPPNNGIAELCIGSIIALQGMWDLNR